MSLSKSLSAKSFLLSLLLGLVILCVFSPALYNDFVNWDDDVHLLQNPYVQNLNPQSIKDIFTTTVNTTYIPLTELSFALQHHFSQKDPFVYHGVNLILHVFVSLLVMQLALRLGAGNLGAFLAGLLFGIHPMHVESVVWVTQRKDVLYASFYMMSLLVYCEYLRNSQKNIRLLYWVYILGFLSALAKPMALSLPLALGVLDWYFKRPLNFRSVVEKGLLGLLLLPIIWMTYMNHQRVLAWEFPQSVLLVVWEYVFYLRKFFWPDVFMLFYKVPAPITLMNFEYWFAFLLAAILSFSVFRAKSRILWFALVFYTVSIFYLIRVDQLRDANIVADRFMYLASAGFCVAFGFLAENYLNQRKKGLSILTAGIIIAIFGCLFVKTQFQIGVWKNGMTLWEHQIAKEPRVGTALLYNKAGEAYFQRWQIQKNPSDAAKARLRLEQATAIRPDYSNAFRNRGQLCLETGDLGCAEEFLNRARTLDPEDFEVYFQLGRLSVILNRKEEAKALFSQAISKSPGNLDLIRRTSAIAPIDTLTK